MKTKITTGLTGIILALSVASCNSDSTKCETMNYNGMSGRYNTAYENKSYGSNTQEDDSDPKCREGCSYKSDVGCCWCPE